MCEFAFSLDAMAALLEPLLPVYYSRLFKERISLSCAESTWSLS